MAKRLFIGNLSWDTTDEGLQAFFASAGTVTSAKVITDRYTGKKRGFGFVEMSTDEEADKAMKELNGQQLDGRPIVVNEARERENNGGGTGGGGSRGGFDNNRGGGGRGGFDRGNRRGGSF